MEDPQTEKKIKTGKPSRTTSLRVNKDTKRKVLAELTRINRKDFGRQISADDYLTLAMTLVTPEHVEQLQEASLSNADRFERDYRAYIAEQGNASGNISKDRYLGMRLNGDIKPPVRP